MHHALRGETADFRAYLAAYLADYHGLTIQELAAFMGVSSAARAAPKGASRAPVAARGQHKRSTARRSNGTMMSAATPVSSP